MNKRSFLFVLSLTLTLFLVNQFFTTNRESQVQKVNQEENKQMPLTNQEEEPPFSPFSSPLQKTALGKEGAETFYVLENETMQLVFSNVGGALAEINLPFHSKTSPDSVVLPVNFDRIIDKKYPSNGKFPNNSYYSIEKESKKTILMQPKLGGYYPLLRRGVQKEGSFFTTPSKYYAFNIASEDPATAETLFELSRLEENLIEFTASSSHRRITKTYSFPKEGNKAPYCVNVTIKVEGDARRLYVTSGVPEVEMISGSPAPAIKYTTVQGTKLSVEKLSLPKTSTTLSSFAPNWISNDNGYFGLILDPLDEIGLGFEASQIPGNLDPSRITVIDAEYDLYPPSKYPGYLVQLPLRKTSEPVHFRLFAGPLEHKILHQVDATYTDQITGYNPRYTETQTFHGWFAFVSEPFARFLFFLMQFFFKITHSWGFSIILLTIALRVMMYPLNAWSIKSTLKLQEISPKISKIQEKHKKDPKRAQLEVMQAYKEHKVNPFSGCLPLIIQMPFLIGMFDLLKSTFSLRGVSFIPGWIDNLTAPDVLFSWNYPIFFFGTEFHLLPFLLGVVMYFQQKLSSSQTMQKGPLSGQQKQQQKMGSIMTIVFTFLFYSFPSGLNIYWLSSMLLAIFQQLYASKRKGKNPKKITVI